jgi:putative PIN family toxin of toxin-antitoxin system
LKLIEAAAAGSIEIVASPALLAELQEVLSREHLSSRLARHRSTVEQAIALYAELVIGVSPLETPRVVPGDADDDHVVAVAVAGGAAYVVSGDRHLLGLGSHRGIHMLSVTDAIERIEVAG